MTNSEYATHLRQIADVYDSDTELSQPASKLYVFIHDKEKFAAAIKQFGPGQKRTDDNYAMFVPDAAPMLELNCRRDLVCRRIVVGVKHVDEISIPATEAHTIPAHDEEIVKWECSPFLETEEAPIDAPAAETK